MSQVVESAASRRRRRNTRTAVILVVLVAVLAGAFYYAASYFNRPSSPAAASGCATGDITVGPKGGKAAVLTPSQITVNVYNSTTRAGLASDTAKSVKDRGFVVAKVANDPLKKNVPGTAELRFGPSGQTAAALVAPLVAGAASVNDGRADATVDLVLGSAFQGLTPVPSTVTATPPNPC